MKDPIAFLIQDLNPFYMIFKPWGIDPVGTVFFIILCICIYLGWKLHWSKGLKGTGGAKVARQATGGYRL